MDQSDYRARYFKAAALVALLMGFLTVMVGVGRALTPGHPAQITLKEWVLPETVHHFPGDQMQLEQSLASLDWQLGQPAGLNADSEKALLQAVAAYQPAPGETLPTPVATFISRSFPDRGAQIQSLLECFAEFKQLEATTSPAADRPLELVLASQVDLQTACFGETVAARLFDRYRQMLNGFVSPDGPLVGDTDAQRPPVECNIAACQIVRGNLYEW